MNPGKPDRLAAICEAFRQGMAQGRDRTLLVTELVARHGIGRSAIYRNLVKGGLHTPMPQAPAAKRASKREAAGDDAADKPRVSRDPCPRCGCRGDFDCGHDRGALGCRFG